MLSRRSRTRELRSENTIANLRARAANLRGLTQSVTDDSAEDAGSGRPLRKRSASDGTRRRTVKCRQRSERDGCATEAIYASNSLNPRQALRFGSSELTLPLLLNLRAIAPPYPRLRRDRRAPAAAQYAGAFSARR
jgi:hypothetical protein